MAPPKLARNSPIAQILKPVRVNFFIRNFRNKARLAIVAQFLQSEIAQLLHATKPLRRDQRLDYGLAALAFGNREFVIDNLFEQPQLCELLDNFLAGLITVEPG